MSRQQGELGVPAPPPEGGSRALGRGGGCMSLGDEDGASSILTSRHPPRACPAQPLASESSLHVSSPSTLAAGRAAQTPPTPRPASPASGLLLPSFFWGLCTKFACTLGIWEARAVLRHRHSLRLSIHLEMPEHFLHAFVIAVDLVFDLSYLIKAFLKRCFSLFQVPLPHS